MTLYNLLHQALDEDQEYLIGTLFYGSKMQISSIRIGLFK